MSPLAQLERATFDAFGDYVEQRSHALNMLPTFRLGFFTLLNSTVESSVMSYYALAKMAEKGL